MDESTVRDLSSRLHGLLTQVADRLADEQVESAAEFIDAGEYGLALEFIADYLSEDGREISEFERSEMTALVGKMGMDGRVERALAFCPKLSDQ